MEKNQFMPQDVFEKIMTLAKRRGFIYPSFEIYGGVAGFYDYGPLGSRLKENIENLWKKYYKYQDNCIEIQSANVTLFEVLKASGHVDEFTDLTVDCKQCNESFKVEGIIEEEISVDEALKENLVNCPNCGNVLKDAYPVNLMFQTKIGIGNSRDAFLRPETAQGIFTNFHLLYRFAREKLPFGVIQIGKGFRNEVSPRQGIIRLREFNMAEAEIFFDPDIKKHSGFYKIKNKKIHLFDNEKEVDISYKDAVKKGFVNNEALAYYMYLTNDFLLSIGVDPKKLRFRKHADDELAHYAQECWDAELYSERFGWVECVGIADRSAYDLESHINSSNNDMYAMRKYDKPKTVKAKRFVPKMDVLGPKYKGEAGLIKQEIEKLDAKKYDKPIIEINGKKIEIPKECYDVDESIEKITGDKFVPHVIEPSYGIDRILYCVLEHNYKENKKEGEEYRLLKLRPSVSPIKTGVFPLVNNEKLVKIAQEIDEKLRENCIDSYYDESGSIGRRYARMDEIGTPFCITVDHDTLKDDSVTIRNRDTTKQKRIKISKTVEFLKKEI